jgi:excisionase family DNA binding protein
MSTQIILHAMTPEEFAKHMESIIEKKLKEILEEYSTKKTTFSYLSRKQVTRMLHVSLPTLHEWTKEGRLISYQIGNRVLYRSDEIEACLRKRKFHY